MRRKTHLVWRLQDAKPIRTACGRPVRDGGHDDLSYVDEEPSCEQCQSTRDAYGENGWASAGYHYEERKT